MKSSNVAVILFPGSNCELEALRAVRRSKMEAELIRWNDESKNLNNYDAFVLPGGFSYEDRGRSGVIASKDPIMNAIKKEANKGKPVIGLCNGCQILVESGLIPGLKSDNLDLAMAWNIRMKKGKILGFGYYNDWVYIRSDIKPKRSVFNRFNSKTLLRIPVAHGEGRFTTQDPKVLKELIKNEQTLFRYCDKNGKFTDEFPVNTNGSMYNLAGVCNPEGNVLALMPHPERTIEGQAIWDSLADYLKSPKKLLVQKKKLSSLQKSEPLKSAEKHAIDTPKQKPDFKILIQLIITDNEERTLENTLKGIGFPDIEIKRKIYLGFYVKEKKNLQKMAEKLISSGEILNLNKEIPTVMIGPRTYRFDKEKGLIAMETLPEDGQSIIAMEYENYAGKTIYANLKAHEHMSDLQKVERGIHWTIKLKDKKEFDEVIQSHIFHNPHSMKLIN